MFRLVALALAALLATLAPRAAEAVTITFTTPDFVYLGEGGSYTESGFTFTGVSGQTFALEDGGNPTRSLWVGFNLPVSPSDMLSIARTDGGLFIFESFDFAAFSDGFVSDGASFLGYLDDVLVHSLVDVAATSATFTLGFATGFTSPIDEIRIIGASVGNTSLMVDNMVMSEVPAPAAAALLPVALAGLAAARRRRG